MKPYYDEDGITLYHGDCLNVLPTLGDFDVAFADPPYNFGFDYGNGYDDKRDPTEYEEWCEKWFGYLRERTRLTFVTPGHGNQHQWMARKPKGIAAWYKPGNPSGAGMFQFCEWEPVYVWGKGPLGGSDVFKATLNPTFKSDVGHPCPKPELLVRRVLAASRGTSLIDPFVGSGTSLVAAKTFGIPAVGIEQNERYCEVAAKRLAQGVLDFGETA